MKKQLLTAVVLAFGLHVVAAAKSPSDGDTMIELATSGAESHDVTWGIGRRLAEPDPSETPQEDAELAALTKLETAFWLCDYVATTRGVEATPVATCGAVYDELKSVKFAGDFSELLAWWKQNKVFEHRKIASDHADATAERVDIRY